MNEVRVVYDGACPLCRVCVRRLRSRSADERFRMIDARTDAAERSALADRGLDLNDGIAVLARGESYSGPAAAHALALMHQQSGLAEKAVIWCFSSQRRAERFYPLFKAVRRFLLFVLNRRLLS